MASSSFWSTAFETITSCHIFGYLYVLFLISIQVSCVLAMNIPIFSGDPNGRGTLIDENGARYEGHFLNHERHGRGTLFFPDGGFQSIVNHDVSLFVIWRCLCLTRATV